MKNNKSKAGFLTSANLLFLKSAYQKLTPKYDLYKRSTKIYQIAISGSNIKHKNFFLKNGTL